MNHISNVLIRWNTEITYKYTTYRGKGKKLPFKMKEEPKGAQMS
jgi:hypothetical protein